MKRFFSSMALVVGFSAALGFSPARGFASKTEPVGGLQLFSTGKIYDLKERSKHLFNSKSEIEISGDNKRMVSTYTDLEGKVLVLETTQIKIVGSREVLVSYELDHKQMAATGKIEVRDGRAHFSYTLNGETKTASEKVSDDFLISNMISAFLKKNVDLVKNGETLKIRLGVADRRETVGFSFSKIESEGDGSMKVKMRPSSIIIAALVNPLVWKLDSAGTLVELEGRLPVKTVNDGKFNDFDGFAVYTLASTTASKTSETKK